MTTHSENLLRTLICHTADSWRKIADNAHLHFKDCVDLGFIKAKLNNSAEKAYKFVEDGEQGGIDFYSLIQLVEDMQFFITRTSGNESTENFDFDLKLYTLAVR